MNPFNKEQPAPGNVPDYVPVVDSILTCDQCFEEVTHGRYYEKKKLLTFECQQGHKNEVCIEL